MTLAIRFIEEAWAAEEKGTFEIIRPDGVLAHRAASLGRRFADINLSWADLVSFAVCQRDGIREAFGSVVQRKVLTPNYFTSLAEVKARPLRLQERYQEIAKPFAWKFTREDLTKLLLVLPAKPSKLAAQFRYGSKEYVTVIVFLTT